MNKHAEEYELLELAAMAAGVKFDATRSMPPVDNKFFGLWLIIDGEPNEYTRRRWNPLTDDGDALRLAVKLKMLEEGSRQFVELMWRLGTESGPDDCAATRRAITRAAAEIGKSIGEQA